MLLPEGAPDEGGRNETERAGSYAVASGSGSVHPRTGRGLPCAVRACLHVALRVVAAGQNSQNKARRIEIAR